MVKIIGASLVSYYSASSPEAVFKYFDTCYANQALIYNSATADSTYNQVINLVGSWVTTSTNVTIEEYYEGMNQSTDAGSTIEFNSRYQFKYSTLHNVWATPMYFINGLNVQGIDTYDDWVQTLDPLLDV